MKKEKKSINKETAPEGIKRANGPPSLVELKKRVFCQNIPKYLVDKEIERWEEIEQLVLDVPELKEYKEKLIEDGNSSESTAEALVAQIFVNQILEEKPYLEKYLRPVSANVNLEELKKAIEIENRIIEVGPERGVAIEKYETNLRSKGFDVSREEVLGEIKQARL